MTVLGENSTVLVLGGESRAALAVTRALGKLKLRVFVASPDKFSIASASRYCNEQIVTTDSADSPNEYRSWLANTLAELQPTLVIPTTGPTLRQLLLVLNEPPQNTPPLSVEVVKRYQSVLPSLESFDFAEDKTRLLSRALEYKIRAPKTICIQAREIPPREFEFPLVLKPNRSDSEVGQRILKFSASYHSNRESLISALSELPQSLPVLLQEVIEGEGVGVHLLFREGEVAAAFAHRRLLEKPPSGGVSVLSESVPLSSAPFEESVKLLKSLNWNGVAMVEWKKTSSGEFVLMEVNPRFWGTLQLAIDCGVNFPALLVDSRTKVELGKYTIGEKLRWSLGLVDHLYLRWLKGVRSNSNGSLRDVLKARGEICRLSDPYPGVVELLNYLF